jgi:subtilisin
VLATVVGLAHTVTAAGQGPARVNVLIGFTQQPGPDEEALVRQAGGAIKYTYDLVPAIAASVPESAIDGLLKNPKVTWIEPDIEVQAAAQVLPWGVNRIDAEVVHAGGNKGAGVKVAVIDTGVDYRHTDLDGNYAGGKDFVNKDLDPMDDNGHGTHVAGTLAAEDNNAGVVGVAPQARLYALKVLNSSANGYWSDVIAAMDWAVANRMQVANLSLGGSSDPGITVKAAFDNAQAAGLLTVAIAGNMNGGAVIYPAKYQSVIAVSATTDTDTLASFSSIGSEVELAAPGKSIYSTYKGGGYATLDGTSMASPHVAGTAALVIASGITDANGNGKINDEVRQRLRDTADDLGPTGKDNSFGYGLVDADGAALPPPTSATGAISGTVTDGSNVAISGATVSVDTGQSATTASNGAYTVSGVPAGGRSVTASATGFGAQTKSATVNKDQTTTVSFTLTATDGGGGGPPPCKGPNKKDPGC